MPGSGAGRRARVPDGAPGSGAGAGRGCRSLMPGSGTGRRPRVNPGRPPEAPTQQSVARRARTPVMVRLDRTIVIPTLALTNVTRPMVRSSRTMTYRGTVANDPSRLHQPVTPPPTRHVLAGVIYAPSSRLTCSTQHRAGKHRPAGVAPAHAVVDAPAIANPPAKARTFAGRGHAATAPRQRTPPVPAARDVRSELPGFGVLQVPQTVVGRDQALDMFPAVSARHQGTLRQQNFHHLQ